MEERKAGVQADVQEMENCDHVPNVCALRDLFLSHFRLSVVVLCRRILFLQLPVHMSTPGR
jgi:hypothetical protein